MNFQLVGHLISGQLVHTVLAHRRKTESRLHLLGLHIGQEMILLTLEQTDGLSQSELAALLDLDISTITKVVQRMERTGVVQRAADPDDARVSRVYLTLHGRELCAACHMIWIDLEQQLTHGLTDVEQVLLHRLLTIVAKNLED